MTAVKMTAMTMTMAMKKTIDIDYDSNNVNIDNEPRSFMSILSYSIIESHCFPDTTRGNVKDTFHT